MRGEGVGEGVCGQVHLCAAAPGQVGGGTGGRDHEETPTQEAATTL